MATVVRSLNGFQGKDGNPRNRTAGPSEGWAATILIVRRFCLARPPRRCVQRAGRTSQAMFPSRVSSRKPGSVLASTFPAEGRREENKAAFPGFYA